MKYLSNFLFMVLCGSVISCKSPNQVDQTTVSNSASIVTLVPNKTTVNIGDTLKVTVHASDATLSNGSLDFKDGTIINFINVTRVFDTTSVHVSLFPGTYPVTATFSDG